MIAACEQAGVRLGVALQRRTEPEFKQVQAAIAAGKLGQIVLGSISMPYLRGQSYYDSADWRGTWALDGGGALMNQGIHTVDLLQWLFGPVAQVGARTATRLHKIEVEDTAAAVLEFASGALGVIEATTSSFPGYARRLDVTGSEGTLVLEGDQLVGVDLRDQAAHAAAARESPENASSPTVSDSSAHQRVFEDFFGALEAGRAPACDAREARHSVAIVEAVYRSARSGKFERP
jgi:UDP-N-acetyl-2-amino-2-deoxyglucuronate dehydrogenase